MAVKLRLRKQGRQHTPSYRIVATDERNRRDGRYLEALGWYHPTQKEDDKILFVDVPRVEYWLSVGAALTEKTRTLVHKVAPNVIKQLQEKELAKREKLRLQRKARRAKKKELVKS